MKGTIIKNLKLTKVIDGDTVKIMLDNKEESIRFVCLDTEESQHGSDKPVTNAGILASKWAKAYFGANEQGIPADDVRVDIEFDTNDPVKACLRKHRDNYGRLLCYVYKSGTKENSNLRIVQEGWSPYFAKYGRSRLFHLQFMEAEAHAQAAGIAIWNPATNAGGDKRDYSILTPWWNFRDSVVQDYRLYGLQAGALSVRTDYEAIVEAAKAGNQLTVLCDLQTGINAWTGGGALIYAGSIFQKFNLWIPNCDSLEAQIVLKLIENRYGGQGRRNYVYVSGEASMYPSNAQGKPQIVITDVGQLKDFPLGDR